MQPTNEKLKQFMVRLPESFWIDVQEYCLRNGINNTEFTKRAFKKYMNDNDNAITETRVKELIAIAFSERCLRCSGDVNISGNITGGDLAVNK